VRIGGEALLQRAVGGAPAHTRPPPGTRSRWCSGPMPRR
jgi:hypothetical protein